MNQIVLDSPKKDIDKFIEFYSEFGFELKAEQWSTGEQYLSISTKYGFEGDDWASSNIVFDKNGKFLRQEIHG
jgi:hypothetical protein